MLRSCSYCGKIHDSRLRCARRPSYARTEQADAAAKIRRTERWKRISWNIRERDAHICQVCRRRLFGTIQEFNTSGCSVHHIEPLEECEERAYDPENLITLCRMHHELAERGEIPREVLHAMAAEQEGEEVPRGVC